MNFSQNLALWLGIGGGLVGLLGGIVGTRASYRAAKSSRERRFIVKAAALMCAGVGVHLALLLTLSTPYRLLLWLPYSVLLALAIVWMNRRLIQLRQGRGEL